MWRLVKSFTQHTGWKHLTALSLVTASVSVVVPFEPLIQFTSAAFLVLGEVAVYSFLREIKLLTVLNLFLSVLLTGFEGFAAFLVISALIFPFRFTDPAASAAFATHLSDAFTTYLALGQGLREANPVLKPLTSYGVLPVMLLSKAFFVGLPLIYVYYSVEESEREFLFKAVIVLGLSLTARNLIHVF
ncbi:MAG: DUF5658 family protein [Candidatus Nanohalobium sp.]